MHFVIVEDIEEDRKHLIDLIKSDCAAHDEPAEFSVYSSAEDFLADFRRGFCIAVFLDIMLGKGITGIDAAWKVREKDEYLGRQHLKLAQENRQKHFRIEGSTKTFPFNADSFTHISVFTEG